MLMLRDTPEGLTELVETRPTVLATFGTRTLAERFLAFYLAETAGAAPATAPSAPPKARSRRAAKAPAARPPAHPVDAPAAVVDAATLAAVAAPASGDVPPAPQGPAPDTAGIMAQLPAVARQAPAPVIRKPKPIPLSERERAVAIERMTDGGGLMAVAQDMGIAWTQLRGVWAAHKQRLQKHIAEGGPELCAVCKRSFIPSLTHPDLCARCSRA